MKLTKRISLLMAIVMIVTTIMSVMPVTVIAADAPAGVSVLNTATGQAYEHSDGTKVENGTWADALALANSATSPVTIVLYEDVSTTARPDFDNTSAVIVEGNGHMLSIAVSGGANNCLIGNKGNNTVVKFQNLTIKLLANGGTGIKVLGKANATFENVFVTGRTKWAVFNLETVGGNMTLNLKNSIISATVEGTAGDSTRSAIFTGNGADTGAGKTVTVDINNSVICGPGGVNLSKGTTGTVTVTNSTFVVSDTGGNEIGVRLSGVEKDDSSKSSCTITGSTIYAMGKDVAITPVSNGGAGTVSGSFNTSIPVTVLANGVSNGKTYTSWGNAVADANAALANGNAEIRLNGNVYLDIPGTSGVYANASNGSASNGGYLGAAGGNKLTIAGATGNEKFIIQRAHHALYPTGIVEFKNLTIESNASSLAVNNHLNKGDGEQLIFNNVDIYINGKTHVNHFIEYMEYALGSEANPYKLDFINGTTVQFMTGAAGSIVNGFVWCDYRGGHYVDITVADSTIDLTAGTASAFKLEWCTGKDNAGADCSADKGVGLINMTVTNSRIVTKGAAAITNIEQIKSFTMDLNSVIARTDVGSGGTPFGGTSNKVLLAGNTNGINIDVNGTNYTTWASAVAAANEATDDVVIKLNSNVVVNGQTNFNQANGKKITVDGQGKYGILTVAVNNVMCAASGSTGALEFRNLKVSSHSTGSFVQIYAPVDVTLENVDFLVSPHQKYCLVNSIYDNCIVPATVIFRNVTADGEGLIGDGNAGVNFYRSGNNGMDNFINLIIEDCDFDLGGKAGSIGILEGTTANVLIKDSSLYGSGTTANTRPLYISGTFNTLLGEEAAPEGFSENKTTCTFINATFYGENYIETNVSKKSFNSADVLPETQNGAEVRFKEPTGLRFITDISSDVITNVTSFADRGSVKYGTLVVPTKYLNGFAFDECIDQFIADGNGDLILDIPATETGTEKTANGVTLRAAVINLEGMYDLKLTAMAYIEFTFKGETIRIYSEATDERSVASVATFAIGDVSTTQQSATESDPGYPYAITDAYGNNTGKYSPYTAAEREILAKYAGLN